MNHTDQLAGRMLRGAGGKFPGAQVAIAAALLCVALVPGQAEAAKPSLELVLTPKPSVQEGHNAYGFVQATGIISPAVAAECNVVVDLVDDTAEEGDYRLARGGYTITLVAGEDTESHGFEIEALQDADRDDEDVDVHVDLECGNFSFNPPPPDEVPTAPADTTLKIKDDDQEQPMDDPKD